MKTSDGIELSRILTKINSYDINTVLKTSPVKKNSNGNLSYLEVIFSIGLIAVPFISKFVNARLNKRQVRYVEQISKYLNQGESIIQNFSGHVYDKQIEVFNELREGINLLKQAEAIEIKETNNEKILNLYEESYVYFLNSIRLTFVSINSSNLSGDLVDSSGDSSSGDSSSGDSSSGDSSSGSGSSGSGSSGSGSSGSGSSGSDSFGSDSFGNSENGDLSFDSEEKTEEKTEFDLFKRFLAILKWLKEQVNNNPDMDTFIRVIKIADIINVRALLSAASRHFKVVIKNIRFDQNKDTYIIERLVELAEKIQKLDENFAKKHKDYLQEIEKINNLPIQAKNLIYIENIQGGTNMTGKKYDREINTTYIHSSKTGIGQVFGGEIKGKAKIAGEINETEAKHTLVEAAKEIQNLLKHLEESNPTATEVEKVAYVSDETTPKFKRRVVGALQAGGETAIEEFLDNPYVNVGKAVVKAWMKPE